MSDMDERRWDRLAKILTEATKTISDLTKAVDRLTKEITKR